jgi:hypothetical protein
MKNKLITFELQSSGWLDQIRYNLSTLWPLLLMPFFYLVSIFSDHAGYVEISKYMSELEIWFGVLSIFMGFVVNHLFSQTRTLICVIFPIFLCLLIRQLGYVS